MSSCTLPTLGDKGVSSSHRAAVSENESLSNTSSGVQTYTGVLSLSGAVSILETKAMERDAQFEQERITNPDAKYDFDYTDTLTGQAIQGLNNWLTQEKDAIKPFQSDFDQIKLFELNVNSNEKYYWIQDDGMQKGYYPKMGNQPDGGQRHIDPGYYPHKNGPAQKYFTFLVRERDGQKDIVYIHYVTYIPYKHGMDFIVGYSDGGIPLIDFDTKNQLFEMYSSNGVLYELDGDIYEFDRNFKNKQSVRSYIPPDRLHEPRGDAMPWHRKYWNYGLTESQIIPFILENSPTLTKELAKKLTLNDVNIEKIISALPRIEGNLPFSLSHIEMQSDSVVFELDWITLTRFKNLGLPQGRHSYVIPKKVVMEMILLSDEGLKQEFIRDFGENSGKPFGVALWDKGPNGEDFAWFAWGISLRPLIVNIHSLKYTIPTFDLVFPTMDGAKSLKNAFGRDIVELIQDENSTLPYGSANEKKNLDFAWMRQKNGKIWTASTGNHKWHASDDIDAKSFRPLGVTWGRDKNGFTLHREILINGESAYKPIGNYLPDDVVVIYDAIFYSKKENKIYYVYQGNLTEVSVIGNKISVVNKYSPLNSPDSICTNNDKDNAYSYSVYDERVCYGESGGIFGVVGTRK